MELIDGYKHTDVGLIPEDWIEKKIAQVATLINGRGFKPFEWRSDGLPIIRIQNLNGSDEFNYFQGNYDKKIEINKGQLLFAWSGSRGTSFGPHIWNGSKGVLNYHTWKVAINEREIDSKFFLYALKKLTKFIEETAHGASALVHTQKWEMEGFKFPLPAKIKEQTAIANALSDVDTLIDSLQKLIAKKRQIKQGAMQTLLNPYENGVLKAGWVERRFGDLFKITAGGDLRKVEFSDVQDEKYSYPIYSNAHTNDGLYGYCRTYDYLENVLTITARGGIGFAVVRRQPFAAIGRLLILEPIGKINCKYVTEYINLKIEFASESTGVPQLTAPQISKYEISLPKFEDQELIATTLIDMDTEIVALETKLTKYQQIKQGMMQNLLTGRIRLV